MYIRQSPAAALVLLTCLAASAEQTGAVITDYPCWQGRTGAAAATAGWELIDDWSQARTVWETPPVLPIGYEPHWEKNGWPRGGYASPVVSDGRVFVYYYEPAGEVEGSGGYFNRYSGSAKWIGASDVVVCFDAATGEGLWKRTFTDRGMNLDGTATHHTPCVFDGRVFAMGTVGDIYCLDAATGETIWESDIGWYTDNARIYKAWCLETGTAPDMGDARQLDKFFDKRGIDKKKYTPTPPLPQGSPHGGAINCCLTYADGVVVAPDGGRGLVGLDGRTGERLWRLENVRQPCTSPIRWVHGERTYILTRSQKLSGIDPRSGELLWQVEADHRYTGGAPVVGEGYAVVRGQDTVTGFRIAPAGAERVWAIQNKSLITSWTAMCIVDGYVHYEVQLRNIKRYPSGTITDEMRADMEAAGQDNKWSGLISIELATGEYHQSANMRDWNVSTIAAGNRIFTEKGMWDIADPTSARWLDVHPYYANRAGGWIAPAYADGLFYHRVFDHAAGRTKLVCIDVRTRPLRKRPGYRDGDQRSDHQE